MNGKILQESDEQVPYALSAERAVLTATFADPAAYDRVASVLEASDFFSSEYGLIWQAISALLETTGHFDRIMVEQWLALRGLLEKMSRHEILDELDHAPHEAHNAFEQAKIVRDAAILRRLRACAMDIAEISLHPSGRDAREIMAMAEQKLFASTWAVYGRLRSDFLPMSSALKEAYCILTERFCNQTGLATGFAEFDELTAGLHGGELFVIGSRPGMGKTTFALNIAEHVAMKLKKSVAIFSLQSSATRLAMSLIASTGSIDAMRLRTGNLQDEVWSRVSEAILALKSANIFINDERYVSPGKVRFMARKLKDEHGLDLLIIDELQQMYPFESDARRSVGNAHAIREIKALATELNLPVIVLSRLNCTAETRAGKRPKMSDFCSSGAIEEEADVIGFIHRDEHCRKDSPDKSFTEIIIVKQRRGPIGTIMLKFDGQHRRFYNLSDTNLVFE